MGILTRQLNFLRVRSDGTGAVYREQPPRARNKLVGDLALSIEQSNTLTTYLGSGEDEAGAAEPVTLALMGDVDREIVRLSLLNCPRAGIILRLAKSGFGRWTAPEVKQAQAKLAEALER